MNYKYWKLEGPLLFHNSAPHKAVDITSIIKISVEESDNNGLIIIHDVSRGNTQFKIPANDTLLNFNELTQIIKDFSLTAIVEARDYAIQGLQAKANQLDSMAAQLTNENKKLRKERDRLLNDCNRMVSCPSASFARCSKCQGIYTIGYVCPCGHDNSEEEPEEIISY